MSACVNQMIVILIGLFSLFIIFHFCFFMFEQYHILKGIIQRHILKRVMKKEGILYISGQHEMFLRQKLKKADYFINFLEVVETSEEHKRENYLRNLKLVFASLISIYKKENIGFQIYFVSFLKKYPSIYRDDWNSMINYLIQCCSGNSIYLRENALGALCQVEDTTYLKEALHQMNDLKISHPIKLLSENFLNFTGDKVLLAKVLREEMPNYEETYKVACIEFFSRLQIDFSDFLLELMISSEETMEVKIACMRYFAHVKSEEALPYLYEFLKHDEFFEYAAVCASVLKSYPNKKTFAALKEALSSKNWYVRNNAAASLVSFATSRQLESLKKIEDDYGKDAILYQIARLEGKES